MHDPNAGKGSPPSGPLKTADKFSDGIGSKAARKLNARREATPVLWFGLGMMGLIGWSIVVPTLLGAAAGLWLDKHYGGDHSWTLALLIGGLTLGCFNAWHWIDNEARSMHKEHEHDDAN